MERTKVPEGAKVITGRFVYTMKEKPVESENLKTEARVDLVRKLGAPWDFCRLPLQMRAIQLHTDTANCSNFASECQGRRYLESFLAI